MTDPNAITWQVVGQNDTVDKLPSGATGPGVDVTYQTTNGITATVFIPAADYRDIERIRALISADAAHRVAVSLLAGE